jgi:hypothetical protein
VLWKHFRKCKFKSLTKKYLVEKSIKPIPFPMITDSSSEQLVGPLMDGEPAGDMVIPHEIQMMAYAAKLSGLNHEEDPETQEERLKVKRLLSENSSSDELSQEDVRYHPIGMDIQL